MSLYGALWKVLDDVQGGPVSQLIVQEESMLQLKPHRWELHATKQDKDVNGNGKETVSCKSSHSEWLDSDLWIPMVQNQKLKDQRV